MVLEEPLFEWGRELIVNRRANGTPFEARSASKRDAFGMLGWTARDNQDETRLSGLRRRSGIARPEAQARQARSFRLSRLGVGSGS